MKKINKGYKLKIILFIIITIFSLGKLGYALDFSNKLCLRVPSMDRDRLEDVLLHSEEKAIRDFAVEEFQRQEKMIERIKKSMEFDTVQGALTYVAKKCREIREINKTKPIIFLIDSEGPRGKSEIRKAIMDRERNYAYDGSMFDPAEILAITDISFSGSFQDAQKGISRPDRESNPALKLVLVDDAAMIRESSMSYEQYLGYYLNKYLAQLLKAEDKNIVLWDEAPSERYFTTAMIYQPVLDTPVTVICLTLKGKQERVGAKVTSWDWGEKQIGSDLSLASNKTIADEEEIRRIGREIAKYVINNINFSDKRDKLVGQGLNGIIMEGLAVKIEQAIDGIAIESLFARYPGEEDTLLRIIDEEIEKVYQVAIAYIEIINTNSLVQAISERYMPEEEKEEYSMVTAENLYKQGIIPDKDGNLPLMDTLIKANTLIDEVYLEKDVNNKIVNIYIRWLGDLMLLLNREDKGTRWMAQVSDKEPVGELIDMYKFDLPEEVNFKLRYELGNGGITNKDSITFMLDREDLEGFMSRISQIEDIQSYL